MRSGRLGGDSSLLLPPYTYCGGNIAYSVNTRRGKKIIVSLKEDLVQLIQSDEP